MRAVLSALTTRGRAFVSAGLTAVLCALVLGFDDLARIGVLLVMLPLVAAVVVVRGRHRLGLTRTVSPRRIGQGQSATVQLELSNDGGSRSGVLLLEEQIPYALGPRPRFVLDRTARGWRRALHYRVSPEVRGRFTLGPMSVRVHDPFGLVEVRRQFVSTATLTVTPRVEPLPAIPLSGAWTGSGDNRPRDFAGGSAEDVTVREYRRGDDLRRVHWRLSAHTGELMVRREEQPWQSRATLLIDNRSVAHRGFGPASSLERAVSAAASIATHLAARGFRVRLVTADGGGADRSWHEHGELASESDSLLDALALLGETSRRDLDTAWLDDAHQPGLVVAVLGGTGPSDHPALARIRHGAGTRLAVVLDVERWGPSRTEADEASSSHNLLAAHGWRVAVAAPEEPWAGVWQRLTAPTRSPAHPSGASA